MTPHSVRLYEGPESVPQPLPGSGALAAVASSDARSSDEASPAQHPAHPTLSLVREHTEEPLPETLDQLLLVTLMCAVRDLQDEVAALKRQVRDINHRESF